MLLQPRPLHYTTPKFDTRVSPPQKSSIVVVRSIASKTKTKLAVHLILRNVVRRRHPALGKLSGDLGVSSEIECGGRSDEREVGEGQEESFRWDLHPGQVWSSAE